MTMTRYLIDTNHASYLMGGDPILLGKYQQHVQAGDEFSISITILAELYFAAYASQYRQQNLQRLMRMLSTLRIYAFDQAAAEEFGRIQAEQKSKGRPIPPLDAQNSAVARQQSLTVLTADKHFAYVDQLSVENWLNK